MGTSINTPVTGFVSTTKGGAAMHRPLLIYTHSDQGTGIPPTSLSKLFKPFHRAANVGNIRGTKLGLAIVKESVELHQGTITCESKMVVDTTFPVRLPAL
jgi:signal transduction histidine kinase